MMKNKKLLAMLVALFSSVAVSACAFTGCGGGSDDDTDTDITDTNTGDESGSGSGSGDNSGSGSGDNSGSGSGDNNDGSGSGSGDNDDGQQHTHSYTWTVTTMPTETTAGKATGTCTCTGEGSSVTVDLPALSDSGYYIGGNATEGKSDYTITVSGYTITFTADSIYETVTTSLDISAMVAAVGSTGSITSGSTYGRFTFSGGKMANETTYNTGGNNVYFDLTGTTNSISITGTGASSTKTVTVTLYKLNDDGTTYTDVTPTDTSVWSAGLTNNVSGTFAASSLEAGSYYVETSASLKITAMSITELLEKSNTSGITATASSVDFLMGRTIAESDLGLSVTLNYANGRTDSLDSGYTTDLSTAVDTTKAGTYTVTVTYGNDEYTDTVSVNIYEIDSISVSDHSLNSSRETINVQTVYLKGATSLNTAGLAVTASAKCGDLTEDFVLTTSEYSISSPDLSTAGTQTVTVTASEKQTTYSITVLDLSDEVDKTQVKVDATATAGEDTSSHIVTVPKINDALKLFALWDVDDDETKTINVAAGTYTEKVYIDMPNVTLIGSNTGKNTNETTIVYDAMNGLMDPSGTITYSTTGSATVTITADATNFTAKNITFKNYYNTHELYQQALTITSYTQADACYVEADMAYFENVTFTSYHDTLEAESGRQYYYNCYIEGRTDYIFGNDATAYFYKCIIHSIGAGTTEKNGGYVVATKGGTSSKHVTYGYIFNECTFEGDENVQAGSVSIARGWDDYMTIMVMNSTLDDSFSLEGYGYTTSTLNDRYTKMNVDPVASQLFEYNNTGVGAIAVQSDGNGGYTVGTYSADNTFTALSGYVIGTLSNGTFTASTDGTGIVYQTVTDGESTTYYAISTVVSQSTAANYSTIATIFGTTNGSVTYTDEWAGSNEVYTVSIYTTSDTTNAIATVKVYKDTTLTTSAITTAANTALSSSSLQVSAVYTDSTGTTTYTEGVISSATSVYVTTETKAATSKVEYSYNFSSILSSTSDGLTSGTYYITESLWTTTTTSTILTYTTKTSNDKISTQSLTYNEKSYTYYVMPNGATSSGNGRYFTIDLSAYSGRTVTIEIIATVKSGSQYLLTTSSTSVDADTALAKSAVSSSSYTTDVVSYTGTVTTAGLYYITFANGSSRIYAINITIE